MGTIIHIGIIASMFFFMEFVAWFTHKYIMHGMLWSWHRSHHRAHKHFFEKNDLFAIVFSIPSIALIALGYKYESLELMKYFGFGIMAYGVFYSLFHDILVHRRIKIKFTPKNRYLKRIINAHYIHHKVHTKEGAEAFGFLWAPKKYAPKK